MLMIPGKDKVGFCVKEEELTFLEEAYMN